MPVSERELRCSKEALFNQNLSQITAIQHGKGPMLVLAGPGSGKTTVITKRIQHLIKNQGIDSNEILVISFTKASAIEMQERFNTLMNDEYEPVTFGTFHAVFFQILKQTYHYDARNILRESEKIQILREIYEGETLIEEDLSSIIKEIGKIKNSGIFYNFESADSGILSNEELKQLYMKYNQELKKRQKLDFDDMVLLCYELLIENQSVLNYWRSRFKYILIDEYQDISPMQYEIIKLLALPDNNLFIVGDDDQSIYGFRGANPSIMLGFMEDYKDAIKVLLDVNFRSNQPIVECAKHLISNNNKRYIKESRADRKEGEEVVIHGFKSKDEQNQAILNFLRKKQELKELHKTALIYRTNSGAAAMAEKLLTCQIPFRLKEKLLNPYEHFIGKDLMCYLMIGYGDRNRKVFYQIMNKPCRYIKRGAISSEKFSFDELIKYYRLTQKNPESIKRLQYDIRQIEKMNPYAAINYVRKGIGYEQYLKKDAKDKGIDYDTYESVLNWIQDSAREYADIEQWKTHITQYSEELVKQNNNSYEKNNKDEVSIMTIHGSKGLEFEEVILPDVNEGLIPHKKSVTKEAIEEERRMLYVAMTRAKAKLAIFYAMADNEKKMVPSRFIKEITSYKS